MMIHINGQNDIEKHRAKCCLLFMGHIASISGVGSLTPMFYFTGFARLLNLSIILLVPCIS